MVSAKPPVKSSPAKGSRVLNGLYAGVILDARTRGAAVGNDSQGAHSRVANCSALKKR